MFKWLCMTAGMEDLRDGVGRGQVIGPLETTHSPSNLVVVCTRRRKEEVTKEAGRMSMLEVAN